MPQSTTTLSTPARRAFALLAAAVLVGAGAVVSHDVEAYTIVTGVPARPLRRRFEADVAARLEAIGWWGWPHDELRRALEDFRALSISEFIDKYGS